VVGEGLAEALALGLPWRDPAQCDSSPWPAAGEAIQASPWRSGTDSLMGPQLIPIW
jgi:hypothetical protein